MFFGVFRLSAADLCIFCRVFRHTFQADGDSCYVELFFGKAVMTYLPMCEHPGKILADCVDFFEADLGREDGLKSRRHVLQ